MDICVANTGGAPCHSQLLPNCCDRPQILFVKLNDDPGYVVSEMSAIKSILDLGDKSQEVRVLDLSRLRSRFSYNRVAKIKGFDHPLYELVRSHPRLSLIDPPKIVNRRKKFSEVPTSIISDLHSFFASDRLPSGATRAIMEGFFRRQFSAVYNATIGAIGDNHFCSAMVLNGRHSDSGGFLQAIREQKLPSIYWEKGIVPRTMYLGTHSIHDYYAFRDEFNHYVSSEKTLLDVEAWLVSRQNPNSETNPYSKGWNKSPKATESFQCLFATSSQDEFWSLGDIFPSEEFIEQYQGFEKWADDRFSRSAKLAIRMHPNTVNKSPGYVLREIVKVTKLKRAIPNLRIFWPNDMENTYSLLRRSRMVVVANSTLGAEAIAMGIPAVHLNKSMFPKTTEATQPNARSEERVPDHSSLEQLKNGAIREFALKFEHTFEEDPADINLFTWGKLDSFIAISSPVVILTALLDARNRVFARMVFGLAKKAHLLFDAGRNDGQSAKK